jgi:hypothetical protein
MRPTLSLLAALTLSACGPLAVGNGIPGTVEHQVDGSAFVNDSFAAVTLSVGEATGIVLTCDEDLLERFEVRTEGERVLLTTRGRSALPRTDCRAEVVLSAVEAATNAGSGGLVVEGDHMGLVELENTGSGRVEAAGVLVDLARVEAHGSGGIRLAEVDTCDLSIVHTGSGRVAAGTLQACTLDVENSGSGGTRLAGRAERLDLSVHGSGGFGDEALVVDVARLTLTGSGGAELTVRDVLDARLSGAGGARIHGEPAQRSVDDTGSGRVRFLDLE